jgi:hypothetical protein
MKKSIVKSKEVIAAIEGENEDYQDKYKQRYYEARKEAGLPDDPNEDSFIKYLGLDIPIDDTIE